jgi:prophage maintenance system killer protein
VNKKLAQDLKEAKKKSRDNIIKSSDLPDTLFRRLRKLGWLSEIIKGWYILKTPDADDGESTLWYANFWSFINYYLNEKYENGYCLSAMSSIYLKTESTTIPEQIIVILKSGGNRTMDLPFGTSVMFYQDKKNFPEDTEEHKGLKIISLAKAITLVPENFYVNHASEAELSLRMIKNVGEITGLLVDNGQPVKADIIAGAYEFLGKDDYALQIKKDLNLLAYTVKPKNPFKRSAPMLTSSRIESPVVGRVELLWRKLKDDLIGIEALPNLSDEKLEVMLNRVDNIYVHDAYNSLSIEGYAVTEELIQKIADGTFDSEANTEDKKQEAAMAAKGYYLAFQEVKKFIKKNYGKKIEDIDFSREIQNWYRQLFTPKVQSGLAKASLLIGYRSKAVFIRGSRHVPVNYSFVADVMEKYREILNKENNPWVKAILSHFILVYIHPFPDGNGRTSRFLMNSILVLSGYSWTVIRQTEKKNYFKALECASVENRIDEFNDFIKQELEVSRLWAT